MLGPEIAKGQAQVLGVDNPEYVRQHWELKGVMSGFLQDMVQSGSWLENHPYNSIVDDSDKALFVRHMEIWQQASHYLQVCSTKNR